MSLLPSSPDVAPDTNPRVVGVDSEDADRLMSALSSATARGMLAELHDDPAPPAELAGRVDTSLQNAQYHLSNLEEAGAVEVVGTAYSEKGREMDVYAPADQPLVIFAGRDREASGLRAALERLLGAFAALAVGSLAVQEVFGNGLGRLFRLGGTTGGSGGGPAAGGGASPTQTPTSTAEKAGGGLAAGDSGGDSAGTPASEATTTPAATDGGTTYEATQTATDTAMATPTPEAIQHGADAVTSLPPGALFFLGGLTVLAVAVALDARR